MSFAGMRTFEKNLSTLMDSEAFKNADEGARLNMGYRLLKSKYGIGSFFGFGKVHPLPENQESNVEVSRNQQRPQNDK
jgi:hypothetical protein